MIDWSRNGSGSRGFRELRLGFCCWIGWSYGCFVFFCGLRFRLGYGSSDEDEHFVYRSLELVELSGFLLLSYFCLAVVYSQR